MTEVVTAKDYGLLIAHRMDDVDAATLEGWMPTFSTASHEGYTISLGVIGGDLDAEMLSCLIRVIGKERPHVVTMALSGNVTDERTPKDGSAVTVREWEAFTVVAITADETATYMREVERVPDGLRFTGEWNEQTGADSRWIGALQAALRVVRDAVVGRRDN